MDQPLPFDWRELDYDHPAVQALGIDPEKPRDPDAALYPVFGHKGYLPGQLEILQAARENKPVLGIMATGQGKSLCYQKRALERKVGQTTIVVSPLISLMNDQVQGLLKLGIPAACIHSGLTRDQRQDTLENARQGLYALLYVSPERLRQDEFITIAKEMEIAGLAVDEAHCITTWGHDFRPEYLEIPIFMRQIGLKAEQVMAFTATATPAVRREIMQVLGMKNPDTYEHIESIHRPKLTYDVMRFDANQSYIDTQKPMLDAIRQHAPNDDDAVIIFCPRVKQSFAVKKFLEEQGIEAQAYNSKMGQKERQEKEQKFLNNNPRILIATSAFGMGVDKSNVRLVLHLGVPQNIPTYLHETGRAGRDGDPAHCLLFYNPRDLKTPQYFIDQAHPDVEFIKEVHTELDARVKRIAKRKGPNQHLAQNRLLKLDRKKFAKRFQDRNEVEVNAAIDFMLENSILTRMTSYIGVLLWDDEKEELIKSFERRRKYADAQLDQMVRYATDENPTQNRLLELFEEEINLAA